MNYSYRIYKIENGFIYYLSNPENVQKVNGALSPLVGSVEYGEVAR